MLQLKKIVTLMIISLLLQPSYLSPSNTYDSKLTCKSPQKNSSLGVTCSLSSGDIVPSSSCNFSQNTINNYRMLFCLKDTGDNQKLHIELHQLEGIKIYDLTIDYETLQRKSDINGWYNSPQEIFFEFKENSNRLKIDENGVIKLSVPYGFNNLKTKVIPFVTIRRIEHLPDVVQREVSFLKRQNRRLTSTLQIMTELLKKLEEELKKLKKKASGNEDSSERLTKEHLMSHIWDIYNEDKLVQSIRFSKDGFISYSRRRPEEFNYWQFDSEGFLVIYNSYRQMTYKLTHNFRDFMGKWILQGQNKASESSQRISIQQKQKIITTK